MKVFFTESFRKDFGQLPRKIQRLTEKQLEIFCRNPRYPSLNVKKMAGLKDIWEGMITSNYRFTFQLDDKTCVLRRIGTHDILKKGRA